MRSLGAAIALLTRVPVGRAAWNRKDLNRSVKWIPFVGGLIGLVVAVAYAGLTSVMPAMMAAGLAVTLGVLITGAFHEDGLADTVDAFGGGTDRDDTLRIMKDPTHGTYGVIALVLSVVLRVAALATMGAASALAVLPAVHGLSRGGAIGLMGLLPPASGEGIGASHDDHGLRRQVVIGVLLSLLVGVITLGWWLAPFVLLAGAGTATIGVLAYRHISGFTGDVLGAAEQVNEVLLLVLGATLAASGKIEVAWWR